VSYAATLAGPFSRNSGSNDKRNKLAAGFVEDSVNALCIPCSGQNSQFAVSCQIVVTDCYGGKAFGQVLNDRIAH